MGCSKRSGAMSVREYLVQTRKIMSTALGEYEHGEHLVYHA